MNKDEALEKLPEVRKELELIDRQIKREKWLRHEKKTEADVLKDEQNDEYVTSGLKPNGRLYLPDGLQHLV